LIYRIGNLCLRFPRYSGHTSNPISACLERCPGSYSRCCLSFSPWQPGDHCYVHLSSATSPLGNSHDSIPHWHVLVLEGGFTRYDRFVYLPIGADEGSAQGLASSNALALFLREGTDRPGTCEHAQGLEAFRL
jgi:hypothetical protein